MVLQEDLAAAEAELAGWYETMQRETHALKRIYQQTSAQDSTQVALERRVSAASSAHPEGNSPTGPRPQNADAPVPEWLTKGKCKMSDVGKADKIAAQQLPQVQHCQPSIC